MFFVLAEVAPKTWAILHADRAALPAARPVTALAGFPPLRRLSKGLIAFVNGPAPGKGLKRGRTCRRRSSSRWPTSPWRRT